MQIQHNENENCGKFYIEEKGKPLAELVYNLDVEGILTIEHTQVSDKLARKGIGNELVRYAVEYARKSHLKIDPQCPFAREVIHKQKIIRMF